MAVFHTGTHDLYYEIHGHGTPALIMGGWGTFCHGQTGPVPRSLFKDHRLIMFDYPGIGESTDDAGVMPSTSRYAADVAALLDSLSLGPVHFVGLVGLGACVGQELAVARPDLVKSLAMAATWAKPDHVLHDQIEGLRRAFISGGFEVFQILAASLSFAPEFYNDNRDQLIGPQGAWSDLKGRDRAVSRLVDACLSHDATGRLHKIRCPTLVFHGGRDLFTGPRFSRVLEAAIPGAIGYEWPELAHIPAGGDEKKRFDRVLAEFHAKVGG
ncbi:MAG: alpha/beta hydrolase [Alphaproteobacteria bacterium]